MNKILLATTALVATAGFAAAEVNLSGSAEIGIRDAGASSVEFHHDLDVRFTLAGQTDGGLEFGATIDLDELDTSKPGDIPSDSGPHAVFISGGFGTLTMGDTDGALDWAMQEIAIGSAIADDHSTYANYNGNGGLDGSHDGQVLRYNNSFGDFSFALSAELNDDDTVYNIGANAGDVADNNYGLGLKYNVALGGLDLGLGLGYQTGTLTADLDDDGTDEVVDADVIGLSVDTTFANGLRAILNHSMADISGVDLDSTGLGLGYTSGALTVSANYTTTKLEGASSIDGHGIAVNYDLGGAAVQFGYGDSDAQSDATWSLGLAMSF